MTTRADQVITLSQVNSLIDDINTKHIDNTSDNQKSTTWKDLGNYLDKKVDIIRPTESSLNENYFIKNAFPGRSYLSQSIAYKICNSCQRPIGLPSLNLHYQKCVEMKQKRQQEQAELAANNNSNGNAALGVNKRKRKNGVLSEVEYSSSVDSTRNNTPAPNSAAENFDGDMSSNSNGASSRPKKKYKKSQAQKAKEAANAAAAAASQSGVPVEKPVKRKKNTTAGTGATGRRQQEGGAQLTPPAAAATPAPPSSSQTGGQQGQRTKAVAKAKGPVDVDKQCGVALASGGLCARSLTCKTHSMGAKRAVLGRTQPYDVLLQQYQKRNQAKIAQNHALAAQRREAAAFHGEGADLMLNRANKVLDPDEETHLVLEGLSKNNPIPLERKIMMPVRYRHRFLQAREFYANALIISAQHSQQQQQQQQQQQHQQQQHQGGGGEQTLANQAISGSIGGLQGRCALINVDAPPNPQLDSQTQLFSAIPGEMYQVRAPSKAILMTAQHNNLQQQAFQQQFLKYQQQQQAQQQMLMKQRQQQMQMQMRQRQQQQLL